MYYPRSLCLKEHYILACVRRVAGTLCPRQVSWNGVDQLVSQLVFFCDWRWKCVEGEYCFSGRMLLNDTILKSSRSLLRWLIGDTRWKSFYRGTILIQNNTQSLYFGLLRLTVTEIVIAALVSLSCRAPTVLLLPVSCVIATLYHVGVPSQKSIILTDILGLSLAHNALSLLRIDSFKTGTILLSGLFFYDIWWVFGTEVVCYFVFALRCCGG